MPSNDARSSSILDLWNPDRNNAVAEIPRLCGGTSNHAHGSEVRNVPKSGADGLIIFSGCMQVAVTVMMSKCGCTL
jgi:hypothetical protein